MDEMTDYQSRLRTLIAPLPKVELHRHLPGSLRLQTILELAREYDFDLPATDAEELRRYVQVQADTPADLRTILRTVSAFLQRCFASRAAIARIAVEMVEDAWQDNVVYMEVRFSPWYLAAYHHLPIAEVMAGVADGLAEASARYPVQTGVIVGMTRDAGVAACAEAIDLALSARAGANVVGVDLSGDEAAAPAGQFRALFDRLRSDGRLGITVHAGEASGPESVQDAVELLGAGRIGHGVRVVQDAEVVELVRRCGITLETCPTSNVRTGAVPSLAAHPLRPLLRGGVAATINTDDPGWFDVTLGDEYALALTELGLTFAELRQAVLHAAHGAFLPPASRQALAERIAAAYDEAEPRFGALGLAGN